MEQIRFATQGVTGIGVLFSGELQLSSLFSDPKEPLYAQAKVVLMQNLTDLNDIAECSLLPISSEERILMSPITIEYLFRLSQGKPNQIRLICKAIYSRYSAGLQNDLNITVDVLDNVVELLSQSFQEQSMQVKINAIHNLNSIDLEMLYDMTRYPNWSVKEVVDLDESFRGDTKSELAANRRERKLLEKREYFASIGLMHTGDKKFILVGGEFVSLYLRLWYEIRKYGKLSRKLILGKGPPTPFGEKVEKFISSLAYLVGEAPELNQFVFHESANEEGRIVESVKHRFETIKSLTQRQIPEGDKWNNEFAEMLSLSELVAKNGQYHLLCLSLRNLNNPRELMQVELYFAENPDRTINLDGLIKLLNQQALDARIMIGEWDWFQVKLFDLPSLLEAIGAPSLSEIMNNINVVEKWRIGSVRRLVEQNKVETAPNQDREENIEWINLYNDGHLKEALAAINKKLATNPDRFVLAKLHNDRGYIESGLKPKMLEVAEHDLNTAMDLHFFDLAITLLNLSYIDLENDHFEAAITKIEEALMITLSKFEIEVGYLRFKLPGNHLGFKVDWEQHPANILETAYINMSYALLQIKGYQDALNALQEALSILPNSIRLKHSLARLYLHQMRANLADPIYNELSYIKLLDPGIKTEIARLSRALALYRRKRKA
jgi:tetratricopeptide (TPR) repeat protein